MRFRDIPQPAFGDWVMTTGIAIGAVGFLAGLVAFCTLSAAPATGLGLIACGAGALASAATGGAIGALAPVVAGTVGHYAFWQCRDLVRKLRGPITAPAGPAGASFPAVFSAPDDTMKKYLAEMNGVAEDFRQAAASASLGNVALDRPMTVGGPLKLKPAA